MTLAMTQGQRQSWAEFHNTYSTPKSSSFGVYGSNEGGLMTKLLNFCDGPASTKHQTERRRSSGLFRKPNKGNIKLR